MGIVRDIVSRFEGQRGEIARSRERSEDNLPALRRQANEAIVTLEDFAKREIPLLRARLEEDRAVLRRIAETGR